MDLRQIAGLGHLVKGEALAPSRDRFLTLMVEGAALNMVEIDAESYKSFHKKVSGMAMQAPDSLPEDDKLALIQTILQEFEGYRKGTEGELRDRQNRWRRLTAMQLGELLERVGVDAGSAEAVPLVSKIAVLETSAEIQEYSARLQEFLHPSGGARSAPAAASALKVADRSTANDNAAGLRGGGSAVAYLKRMMERGGNGHIALFRLGCLEIISERFGLEAVQDSVMAVSAFLTHNLHSDDAIFHWSDSSLLIILEGRASEQILTAELQRIVSQNRDITVNISGRTVMLRIPLDFELTPIACLRSAEDLYKLSAKPAAQW